MPANEFDIANKPEFFQFFYQETWRIFVIIVIPLFLLLALNVVALILYIRKVGQAKKVKLNDLSAEEKEALRQELLKDISKESNETDK